MEPHEQFGEVPEGDEIACQVSIAVTRGGKYVLVYPNDELGTRGLIDKARSLFDLLIVKRDAMAAMKDSMNGIQTGDPGMLKRLQGRHRGN